MKNKRRHTPIPLLSAYIARYNAFGDSRSKARLASFRTSLADAVMRASQPKPKVRL